MRLLVRFWSPKLSILYVRKIRDNHGVLAAVMTDLSKTFDCISHELLINVYGFDELY